MSKKSSNTRTFCSECEDQDCEMFCLNCEESFCRPCFQSLHRRGKRSEHKSKLLIGDIIPVNVETSTSVSLETANMEIDLPSLNEKKENFKEDDELDGIDIKMENFESIDEFVTMCHFIPLRLSPSERSLFLLLEAALATSEYTDKVDVSFRFDRDSKIIENTKDLLALITGLRICNDLKSGKKLIRQRMRENEEFFQVIFEIGRRFKIMNPEKMRETYGKLMYMLQDSISCEDDLKFKTIREINCVHRVLTENRILHMLKDKKIVYATLQITNPLGKKTNEQLAAESNLKKECIALLCKEYQNDTISGADIERILFSISDSNNYLKYNMEIVEQMIDLLTSNFKRDSHDSDYSLSLTSGMKRSYFGRGGDGAKLSHDHPTQYTFVWQSLELWKEIMKNMYCLWYAADQDLLSDHSYRLWNTGQGLNRVQSCPAVSGVMSKILRTVQKKCGSWVGLSVVHLGDRDVPNALMFIDKYTQVPRILSPIINVIQQIEALQHGTLLDYVTENFGARKDAKMEILCDFFKHAFDGDGDDGGSCIDGRLTSTWNWCSKIEKKKYYHLFSMLGFQGFDGDWKN